MVQHPVVEMLLECEGRHVLLTEESNYIDNKICYLYQTIGFSHPTDAQVEVRLFTDSMICSLNKQSLNRFDLILSLYTSIYAL